MKKTVFLLCAALLAGAPVVTAQASQKITAGKANEYGLAYALPLTAIDVYLVAELTEKTPGEFYNYARRYLGLAQAVTKPRQSAELKQAIIVPKGMPDANQRWLAQFRPGSSAFITLNEEGVPLTINSDEIPDEYMPEIPPTTEFSASPLDGPAAEQAITADMARSASLTKKAELAAQRIFELRETRSDLLSGQADNPPADGKAMQLVLDNLAAQEAALTAMFAGVERKRTVVDKVTLVPDSGEIDSRVIARISAVDGILDAEDLAGKPVTLTLRISEAPTLPVNEKGQPKTFPRGGVPYRIPGTALVTVDYDGRTISAVETPMAQLGVVFGLPPTLFTDKNEPYKLIYDPNTGGILELSPKEGSAAK